MNPIFEMRHVTKQFGGLYAVSDFSLAIGSHELIGLIGPNGAGKTTVFNLITGMLKPTTGDVFWKGENITRLPPHLVTARGIARTFQNIKLFSDMTVVENVMVSFHFSLKSNFLKAMIGLPSHTAEEKRIRKESMDHLVECGLADVAEERAQNLPYGKQRLLEIARALATRPDLLLLDEPAAGMNPMEKIELAQFVREIRDRHKIAVLLIEHDMKFVMGLCERIKVLDYGISIAEGTPEEIKKDQRVIRAYLGGSKYAAG